MMVVVVVVVVVVEVVVEVMVEGRWWRKAVGGGLGERSRRGHPHTHAASGSAVRGRGCPARHSRPVGHGSRAGRAFR